MKRTKRIVAALLALMLVMAFVPMTAQAGLAEQEYVTVTVTNATFDGAAADRQGEFVRESVMIGAGMTVGEAIQAACDQAGVSVTGIAGGYISEIGGLKASDGGGMSGWMCAVNNWFSNSFTPLSEPATNGDLISMEYSLDWGADIGSSWNSNDKTLGSLSADLGVLAPDFSSDVNNYTLTLPTGTDSVVLSPLAVNRNFMVKTFVGATEYKLSAAVPVADGTVVTIVCGDPQWPSMNNGQFGSGAEDVAAETYTITIAYADVVDNGGIDENGEPETTVTEDNSPETGDSDMTLPIAALAVVAGLSCVAVVMSGRRRTN